MHKYSEIHSLCFVVLIFCSLNDVNVKSAPSQAKSPKWLSSQTVKVYSEQGFYNWGIETNNLNKRERQNQIQHADYTFYDYDPNRINYIDSSSDERIHTSNVGQGPILKRRKREEDYPIRFYTKRCNHTVDMWPEKVVKIVSPYHGAAQYPAGFDCEWELIGVDTCIPQVTCATIDLRSSENCQDEYLRISDGESGEQVFCGADKGFSQPFTVRGGFYLYLALETGDSTYFDRLYKGVDCTIMCHLGTRPRLPSVPLPPAQILQEEFTCLCGRQANDRDRIVGGTSAGKKEFPWQVALVKAGTRLPFCGGSLINNQFVLTAAHCMDKIFKTTALEILLHAHILDENKSIKLNNTNAPSGQNSSVQIPGSELETPTDEQEKTMRLSVDKIMIHRLYDRFADMDNDIALIRLKKKLNLKDRGNDNSVTPICLPEPEDQSRDLTGTTAIVSGWGYTYENAGTTTKILQKLEVPVLDRSICDRLYKDLGLSENILCAGYEEGGKDACQGDSGGPLTMKEGADTFVQIGIVSIGAGCGRQNKPGIYTKVSNFIPWIRERTRGSLWCRRNSEKNNR